jgi:hypothetical protein
LAAATGGRVRRWCMNILPAGFFVSPLGSLDPNRDRHAEAGHAV